MTIQELSPNNAFIGGSDFWVIPSFEDSSWVRKVDYYLNFQISKAKRRGKQVLNENLITIITEEELDLETSSDCKDQHLMIVASRFLPCQYIVQIPHQNLEAWLQQIKDTQEQLKNLRTRIFLPKEIDASSFVKTAKLLFSEASEVSFIQS